MVQLSHPYMTTGKTIALTRWTFVSKVMSLLFNMLSRLVIAFLPKSKCFLILWLQSPSSVILEPKKIKFVTVSIVSPSICHEMMEPDAMILIFWILSFKSTSSLSSFTLVLYTKAKSNGLALPEDQADEVWNLICCSQFHCVNLDNCLRFISIICISSFS